MNKRQMRELAILVIVLVLGMLTGWVYRTYYRPAAKAVTPASTAGKPSPASTKPINPNEVVARLNGQDITRGEVEKYYRANIGIEGMDQDKLSEAMRGQLRRSALQQIIEERLLLEAAPKRGITITPEEMDAYIAENVLPKFSDQAELEKSVKNDLGLTYAELKEMLTRQELSVKMRAKFGESIKVTDAEVDTEMKAMKEIMKTHPGGAVDLPSRESVRQDLIDKKAKDEYDLWIGTLEAEAKIEILAKEFEEETAAADTAMQEALAGTAVPDPNKKNSEPGKPSGKG
jgi:hypothetical protein